MASDRRLLAVGCALVLGCAWLVSSGARPSEAGPGDQQLPSRTLTVVVSQVRPIATVPRPAAGAPGGSVAAKPARVPPPVLRSATSPRLPSAHLPSAHLPSAHPPSGHLPSAHAPSRHPAPGSAVRTSPAPQGFRSSVSTIDTALAKRMAPTYRAGCPVPLSGLRYLRLSYRGFDGRVHQGELVVSSWVATQVVTVFHTLYDNKFPIRSMRLADDFGGSDEASMAADNTSAFNCRPVTGGSSWSEHSFGEAIDINPRENPYLSGSTVLPPAGAPFVSRPDRPGVIHDGDSVVAAFEAIGWRWGGHWTDPVDLQHFSRSGR